MTDFIFKVAWTLGTVPELVRMLSRESDDEVLVMEEVLMGTFDAEECTETLDERVM